MKQFSCGDVVAGCQRRFSSADEAGILEQVAHHALADHGLDTIPDELVEQVRKAIVSV